MRRVNAFEIAIEIARNGAATILPWRTSLDYYTDWKSYGEGIYATHIEQLSPLGFGIEGKDVLEIGPGSSLWSAYLCRKRGARSVVAIDVRNFLIKRWSGCPTFLLAWPRTLDGPRAPSTSSTHMRSSSMSTRRSRSCLRCCDCSGRVVTRRTRSTRETTSTSRDQTSISPCPGGCGC